MFIIKASPIFRNRFQETGLFFSKEKFSVGSIVIVPFSKSTKPALVLAVDNLENQKSFIRRNKVKIEKIESKNETFFLSENIIKIFEKAEEKTPFSLEEILQKTFTKKDLEFIKNEDKEKLEKISKKISVEYILKKLQKRKIKVTQKSGLKSIGSILEKQYEEEMKNNSLHTEMHYLVNEIREYFGENAKRGKGSFSFYLGFFKKIPKNIIYQYWSEVKQTKKPTKDQAKLFWWKIGQYLKNKK